MKDVRWGLRQLFLAARGVLGLSQLPLIACRSHAALAAENLFLRKQLAFFQERKVKPRRTDNSTRWLLTVLSRLFAWRDALVVVKPETLSGWHRKGFRLFWRWKSKPSGRPQVPLEVRALIRAMAAENISWGEARIANELKLKLGISVSPRTVAKYLRRRPASPTPDPARRWMTFMPRRLSPVISSLLSRPASASFM